MVFLIQNTQNRDAAAVQLKLDELIRVSSSARNRLPTLEDLSEQELDQMKASFAKVATQGGVGEGHPRQREVDGDNAKEGLAKAKADISADRAADSLPTPTPIE